MRIWYLGIYGVITTSVAKPSITKPVIIPELQLIIHIKPRLYEFFLFEMCHRLLPFLFLVSADKNVISRSLAFIDTIAMSAKITAYICGNRDTQILFRKELSQKYQINVVSDLTNQRLYINHLFIVDMACLSSLSVLKEAEAAKLFKPPVKWLLYGKPSQVSNFSFGIDSQVFVLNPETSEIVSLYKLSEERDFFEKPVVKHDDFSVLDRTDLMGETIRVSCAFANPDSLNHLEDYRDTHIDALSKVFFLVTNHLLDYLNASRTFVFRYNWGYKNATTGLYSGMVGDLQQGVAQLGGSTLFFTVDRIPVIEYYAASTKTYLMFVFRAPPLSYVTNVFTLPFDSSVWHYSFVLVGIVVVCVYLIVLWEWRSETFRKKVQKYPDSLRPNFFDAIMMEIGAITQQGSDVEPKSTAGRIITIFMFLAFMFLYTAYSANIVALLQSTANSIRTLEDLLNSRIQLGVEDIIYAHYYFENAKEPVRKAIYQQKVAPKGQKPNFMKANEGIRRVREEFFAFHTELPSAYKIISDTFQESEKCGLKEIAYENLIEPWLIMQKNSTYKEIIKIGMKKIHEYGIKDREIRKIVSRKPQCHTGGSNFGSVGLIDCYLAFLIFATGIAIALLLFVFEIIMKKFVTRI